MKAINRRDQIERSILRRVIKGLRTDDHRVTPRVRDSLKSALRSAAMVGGCEERNRTLEFLRAQDGAIVTPEFVRDFIIRRGVLEVLGYDDEKSSEVK